MLLNLPSLTDPAHPERAADQTPLVDLLFFPTGGGKTEAYLGLTAYTFAIRRLQGVVGAGADARSGDGGVAVLMRYTLRLLTAQQFQRAAALVCAAEVLRRAATTETWGSEPFRIGLWVGGGGLAELVRRGRGADRRGPRGRRTASAPTCCRRWPARGAGPKLRRHRDLRPDDDRRRILLFCADGEGAGRRARSPQTQSPGEGLPILTVDEEIYRLAAQPGHRDRRQARPAALARLRRACCSAGCAQRCPRHGYRHDDLDDRTGCGAPAQRQQGRPARR